MPQPGGVLAARNISKFYGELAVLDGFSMTLTPGSRVGVVGPNGVGKSTLLRVLAGVEQADAGLVSREPGSLTVGYLPQETRHACGSPGEAARAAIEALVAERYDVLLLDEPTNDLDSAGLEYLERVTAAHRGAMVVVSHDRAFLESMSAIVEFEPDTRRVRTYTGGWSAFETERSLRRERQREDYGRYAAARDRVEEQAQRMRQWHERGYGQGRKKKKGRDLGKAIDMRRNRLERAEKPWSAWQLQLTLQRAERGGDAVAGLDGAVIERGGFTLGPIDVELHHGERVAVVGPNGAGKTTLLSALLGEIPLARGSRWVGPGTVLGTLRQGLGRFSTHARLLDVFTEAAGVPQQEARSLLAKFSLGAEDVTRAGSSLSPGERSRAALALLAAQGANALILDEPTNNLDLEAIEQLEAALETFEGTVLLVTHDRRFLDAFAATRRVELGG